MSEVHEIAIRKVKPGMGEPFRQRRSQFIEVLTAQAGAGTDREFESFLALPEPDDGEVFVGMTTYAGLAENAKIQRNPRVVWRFLRFARTMDLKAYLYVTPIEGPPFDLADLASEPGQVLEVAVRRVTDRERFDRARRPFVDLLSSQAGVRDSWEFEVVKGKDADDLAVGMTVYDSREALDGMQGSIMGDPVTAEYFATFEPVALQYAVATTSR